MIKENIELIGFIIGVVFISIIQLQSIIKSRKDFFLWRNNTLHQ